MSLKLVEYEIEKHQALWDEWCKGSGNATFLHTRRFLSYHRNRFKDESVLLFNGRTLLGVLPAARSVSEPDLVVSHPGLTFGGLIHRGTVAGNVMVDALAALCAYYAERNYSALLYKPVPHQYTSAPAQDDLYGLFRLGAQRVRCDLSSTIDLSARREASVRRRRSLKKARQSVIVGPGTGVAELYTVLADNLWSRYGAKPVHQLCELEQLMKLFPEEIQIRVARAGSEIIAGIILFNSARVWRAQYIASSIRGYELCALDAVFESSIEEACESGARYFDFGTSNEDCGQILNDGLYRFKSEFGGGGIAHEFYRLSF